MSHIRCNRQYLWFYRRPGKAAIGAGIGAGTGAGYGTIGDDNRATGDDDNPLEA